MHFRPLLSKLFVLLILGDSYLLINLLNSNAQFNNPSLNKTLQRIRNILNVFEKVSSFHILRELNNQADSPANKACLLLQGNLCINGDSNTFHLLP